MLRERKKHSYNPIAYCSCVGRWRLWRVMRLLRGIGAFLKDGDTDSHRLHNEAPSLVSSLFQLPSRPLLHTKWKHETHTMFLDFLGSKTMGLYFLLVTKLWIFCYSEEYTSCAKIIKST